MKLKTIILSFSVGAIFSDIISFLFDNKYQFIAILAVIMLDLIFGVAKAIYVGNFETRKAFKFLFMLVAFWSLLAVVLLIEKGFPFASFLSEAILLPILLFELISIVKNMSLIGLIPGETAKKILANIDKHKSN